MFGSDTEPSSQVFFLQVNVYGCFLLIIFSSQLDADQRNKLFSITLLWFKDEKVRYLLLRGISVNINHVSFIRSQGPIENSIAGCFKICDTSVIYIFNSNCLSMARTELKTRCSIVNHLWYRLFASRISATSVLSLLWFRFGQFHC